MTRRRTVLRRLDEELDERLAAADEALCRHVATSLALEALDRLDVDHPAVAAGRRALAEGRYDGAGPERAALEELVDEYEARYSAAYGPVDEALERGEDPPPEAVKAGDHWFRRARAVMGLRYALDEDAYLGAATVVYETDHTGQHSALDAARRALDKAG